MSQAEASAPSPKRRTDLGFLICLVGPLAVTVILNALVRPGLARALGGERHSNGAGVRSNDVWWTFDPATQAEHPVLTSFLNASHGLVAMWAFVAIALLFAGRCLVRRWRGIRREAVEHPA